MGTQGCEYIGATGCLLISCGAGIVEVNLGLVRIVAMFILPLPSTIFFSIGNGLNAKGNNVTEGRCDNCERAFKDFFRGCSNDELWMSSVTLCAGLSSSSLSSLALSLALLIGPSLAQS